MVKNSISDFTKKVIQQILNIPSGKVATYKQIGELSGKPYASRAVVWILHSCSASYKLPWHRVINAQGKISFEKGSVSYRRQKRKLQAEGIEFTKDGQLSLVEYQWRKKARSKKPKAGQPTLFR